MKIFVVNCGSSSIKCVLQGTSSSPLWQAHLEWKEDFKDPLLTIQNNKKQELTINPTEKDPPSALKSLVNFLCKGKASALTSLDEVDAVAHRIVHGGSSFHTSVLINESVKKKIEKLGTIAPLHNPPALKGIYALESLFQGIPHIATFDTAFHQTLPKKAKVYPVPYKWYKQGIQRYGFHGISFQYCSKKSAELLGKDLTSLKMVICHLGSGASLCAIKDGVSIDTTMGFTPLEGLMMDTRCGSIDPGILLYLLSQENVTLDSLSYDLYHLSGLLGLSGLSSDMRDILANQNDPKCLLALETYLHILLKNIGAMVASLSGLSCLVFTAGIGENAFLIRERIADSLSFLGVILDKEKNKNVTEEDCIISTKDSKVEVLVVHTQETLEIANECLSLLSNTSR